MKVLFVLLMCLVNSSRACNIFEEMHAYFKTAITKFVDQKYQDFNCLDYLIYQNNPACNRKTMLLPVNTENCNYSREKLTVPREAHQKTSIPTMEQFLNSNNINPTQICNSFQQYNKKPDAEKTKQLTGNVYNSTGRYAVIALAQHYTLNCTEPGMRIQACIRDTSMAVLKYFGITSPPLQLSGTCKPKAIVKVTLDIETME